MLSGKSLTRYLVRRIQNPAIFIGTLRKIDY